MSTALRNDDAEALILDIRTGRTAAEQDVANGPGAFLIFPTSVLVPGAIRGHSVFPLGWEAEPGTVVTGPGRAEVTAQVAGIAVSGGFSWTIGDDPPPRAEYRFRRRGRDIAPPAWARQLPCSQHLIADAPSALSRRQGRLARRGRDAEHWLLTLTAQVAHQLCLAPMHRALRYRPTTDVDDLVQRSLQVAVRLLPVYASKDRPPCSWLGMLRLDGRRDMNREVTRLDWLPADALAALALADACGIDLKTDPGATWDEVCDTAERIGQPVPRIGWKQVEAAVRAPILAAQDAEANAVFPGPGEDEGEGDAEPGQVAAMVARLVTSDPELIGLARAGDPATIRRVADQVIRELTESWPITRLAKGRAWEEFQRSGQLFATAAGRQHFCASADNATLTAIDECLLRAAGIRPGATSR